MPLQPINRLRQRLFPFPEREPRVTPGCVWRIVKGRNQDRGRPGLCRDVAVERDIAPPKPNGEKSVAMKSVPPIGRTDRRPAPTRSRQLIPPTQRGVCQGGEVHVIPCQTGRDSALQVGRCGKHQILVRLLDRRGHRRHVIDPPADQRKRPAGAANPPPPVRWLGRARSVRIDLPQKLLKKQALCTHFNCANRRQWFGGGAGPGPCPKDRSLLPEHFTDCPGHRPPRHAGIAGPHGASVPCHRPLMPLPASCGSPPPGWSTRPVASEMAGTNLPRCRLARHMQI